MCPLCREVPDLDADRDPDVVAGAKAEAVDANKQTDAAATNVKRRMVLEQGVKLNAGRTRGVAVSACVRSLLGVRCWIAGGAGSLADSLSLGGFQKEAGSRRAAPAPHWQESRSRSSSRHTKKKA